MMKSLLDHFSGQKMTIGVGVSLLIGGAASILLILQSAKLLR
jgi:F0F1-type ATP synthase assembly protein I